MERYSASEQETEAIGRELAQQLAPGAVVAFTGDGAAVVVSDQRVPLSGAWPRAWAFPSG